MFKAQAWLLHRDASSWRADAIDFRQEAYRLFVDSMRQKIDVALTAGGRFGRSRKLWTANGRYPSVGLRINVGWTADAMSKHGPSPRKADG